MQSSNNYGGQNRDEYDGIQRQINERTNDSVESTRRMVGLVAESQEVGTNTMIMLDEQGEQLNRVEVTFSIYFSFSHFFISNPFRMVSIEFMWK